MNSPIIECLSVSKHYVNKNHVIKAVDKVSVQINKHEFVVIKGRSGAGKSTLMNLISALDRPTQGKVIMDNTDINSLSNRMISNILAQQVGIVFQSFNLLPTYTIFENLEIALLPTIIDKEHRDQTIMSVLQQLQLIDKIYFLPYELSVGQQQKVAIARTLIKNPSIIFADEPTGSVDQQTAQQISAHLLKLNKEHGVTIIVSTHGNYFTDGVDRIIHMENGRLIN